MSNGNFVLTNQHLLDKQPDDTLTFSDIQRFSNRAHPRQKGLQCLSELQISLPVTDLLNQ